MAAHELVGRGARVALIDRRRVASGSTAASTALVQYEIDTPLTRLQRIVGAEVADAAYLAAHDAVGQIERLCSRFPAVAQPRSCRSLYLGLFGASEGELEEEAAARRNLGIDARWLPRGELSSRFGIERGGAILSTTALEVNPVGLTRALLVEIHRRGGAIVEKAVVDLAPLASQDPPFRLRAAGATIVADWVIVASGYETPEQFGLVAKLVTLKSTFAIATEPHRHPCWGNDTVVWGDADPYFYCRGTPDGRLLAGGADEPFEGEASRDALIESKARSIQDWLSRLCPARRPCAEFSWAGTFAETADGLPYLGPHPCWPRVLFSLGYGGNGITFSQIAARHNAAIIDGADPPTRLLFEFTRPGPAGVAR